MSISQAELESLTRDIWTTMIGLDLVDALMAGGPGPGISSQIEIQGDTEVALRIDCSMELARTIASRLFDMPPEEIEPELVLDAMSEMANVLGGHIKGMWPGAINLSLPQAWESSRDEPAAHEWSVANSYDSNDGQLMVRLG